VDPPVVHPLSREECVGLLGAGGLGRVGVSIDALPAVLPVRFALDDDRIIMRTASGSTLARALIDRVVAFENDAMAGDGGSGWSVLVVGLASELTTPGSEAHPPSATPLGPWSTLGLDHLVQLSLERVSGRAFGPVALGPGPSGTGSDRAAASTGSAGESPARR
jgi:hypothetical protein